MTGSNAEKAGGADSLPGGLPQGLVGRLLISQVVTARAGAIFDQLKAGGVSTVTPYALAYTSVHPNPEVTLGRVQEAFPEVASRYCWLAVDQVGSWSTKRHAYAGLLFRPTTPEESKRALEQAKRQGLTNQDGAPVPEAALVAALQGQAAVGAILTERVVARLDPDSQRRLPEDLGEMTLMAPLLTINRALPGRPTGANRERAKTALAVSDLIAGSLRKGLVGAVVLLEPTSSFVPEN